MIINTKKNKKCKSCGSEFTPFMSTQKVCSINCAVKLAKDESKKQDKKEHAKRKKDFYANDRTRQLKLTQSAFNKMRRLQEIEYFIDKGKEPHCISCGKTNMDWCCGHYKTVGAHGELRFDSKNTYLQCNRYCNMGLSGNISGNKNTIGFTEGLIKRLGPKKAESLFSYLESVKSKKWECEELIAMRKKFNAEIKRLQN